MSSINMVSGEGGAGIVVMYITHRYAFTTRHELRKQASYACLWNRPHMRAYGWMCCKFRAHPSSIAAPPRLCESWGTLSGNQTQHRLNQTPQHIGSLRKGRWCLVSANEAFREGPREAVISAASPPLPHVHQDV